MVSPNVSGRLGRRQHDVTSRSGGVISRGPTKAEPQLPDADGRGKLQLPRIYAETASGEPPLSPPSTRNKKAELFLLILEDLPPCFVAGST